MIPNKTFWHCLWNFALIWLKPRPGKSFHCLQEGRQGSIFTTLQSLWELYIACGIKALTSGLELRYTWRAGWYRCRRCTRLAVACIFVAEQIVCNIHGCCYSCHYLSFAWEFSRGRLGLAVKLWVSFVWRTWNLSPSRVHETGGQQHNSQDCRLSD